MSERITIRLMPLEREILDEEVKKGNYVSITAAVRKAIQVYFDVWSKLQTRQTN